MSEFTMGVILGVLITVVFVVVLMLMAPYVIEADGDANVRPPRLPRQ